MKKWGDSVIKPMAYLRNLCKSVADEFAYRKLAKQAKSYGHSLVSEQLDAGRWYSGEELEQRVEAGIDHLMSDVDGKFRSLSAEDRQWVSRWVSRDVWSGCIEGSIGYKFGFEWRDKEDPWERLIDEGKVLLEKGEHGLGRILPASAERTIYEEFHPEKR